LQNEARAPTTEELVEVGLRAEATRRADPSAAHAAAATAPLKAGALQKLGGARTRLSL
jgi:hypothetical protein